MSSGNNGVRKARKAETELVNLIKERQDVQVTRLDKLELCLYGEDGRGGLCKDIADIKQGLSTATSFVRIFVAPVLVSVAALIIGLLIGRANIF
jgi:hypothetical protein